MKLIQEIPDRFWSLFRSVNRSAYIEALLKISEEYEYSITPFPVRWPVLA